MNRAVRYFLLFLAFAMLHSAALYVLSVIAFVDSFGTSRGGHLGIWASVASILSWPGSAFGNLPVPLSGPWLLSSLCWGIFFLLAVLVAAKLIRHGKKRSTV